MKFLHYELYKKLCSPNGECFQDEWNHQYALYLEEFEKVKAFLPKSFLREFCKNNFHDNVINSIFLEKQQLKKNVRYNLYISLSDYYDQSIEHELIFDNIDNFETSLKFNSFAGCCDWLYCEILKIDNNHLSFEVILFDDSIIHFVFTKIHYRKRKVIDNSGP